MKADGGPPLVLLEAMEADGGLPLLLGASVGCMLIMCKGILRPGTAPKAAVGGHDIMPGMGPKRGKGGRGKGRELKRIKEKNNDNLKSPQKPPKPC